jgi:hypothetical protein
MAATFVAVGIGALHLVTWPSSGYGVPRLWRWWTSWRLLACSTACSCCTSMSAPR